jgi:hypothetical protein
MTRTALPRSACCDQPFRIRIRCKLLTTYRTHVLELWRWAAYPATVLPLRSLCVVPGSGTLTSAWQSGSRCGSRMPNAPTDKRTAGRKRRRIVSLGNTPRSGAGRRRARRNRETSDVVGFDAFLINGQLVRCPAMGPAHAGQSVLTGLHEHAASANLRCPCSNAAAGRNV